MARPEEAVACPSCGARNKAKWVFCARCGESLQGAEAVSAGAAPRKAAAARTADPDGPPESSSRNTILFGLTFFILVAVTGFAIRYYRQVGPWPPPEPATLTVPTQPAQPSPVPSPAK